MEKALAVLFSLVLVVVLSSCSLSPVKNSGVNEQEIEVLDYPTNNNEPDEEITIDESVDSPPAKTETPKKKSGGRGTSATKR